jgi:hypothetical protein
MYGALPPLVSVNGKTTLGQELLNTGTILMTIVTETVLFRFRDAVKERLLIDVSTYQLYRLIYQKVGKTYDFDFIENFITEHFNVIDCRWVYPQYEATLKPKDDIGELCLLHDYPQLKSNITGIGTVLKKYYNIYADINFLGSIILTSSRKKCTGTRQ